MRHEWIFDVLRDLKSYALANGLPGLAQKVDEALRIARTETSLGPVIKQNHGGVVPPGRKSH